MAISQVSSQVPDKVDFPMSFSCKAQSRSSCVALDRDVRPIAGRDVIWSAYALRFRGAVRFRLGSMLAKLLAVTLYRKDMIAADRLCRVSSWLS